MQVTPLSVPRGPRLRLFGWADASIVRRAGDSGGEHEQGGICEDSIR